MKVSLIVNPKAAAGRTGARVEELRRAAEAVFDDVEVRRTEAPGDGAAQAEAAARAGAELVVAVGGDGTANEVVNGLVRAGTGAAFSNVPAGTGADFVKTLRMPRDWPTAFRALAGGSTVRADVVEVRCVGRDGAARHLYGINVVGVGMAGDVVARVNRSSKRLGGTITFFIATLTSLAGWSFPEAALEWEEDGGGRGAWTGPLTNVFLANASWCGGGMCVAPQASLTDGLLDLVVIPRMGLLRLALSTPHLYDGTVAEVPGTLTARVRWLRATPVGAHTVPVDVDGEGPGQAPLEVRCLPQLLPLRLPVV